MAYPGETIRLSALGVTDLNLNPITSPTAEQLVIVDNNGNIVSTQTSLVNDGSGNFHYDFTLPSTAPYGTWKFRFTITNGSYVKVMESTFTVFQLS